MLPNKYLRKRNQHCNPYNVYYIFNKMYYNKLYCTVFTFHSDFQQESHLLYNIHTHQWPLKHIKQIYTHINSTLYAIVSCLSRMYKYYAWLPLERLMPVQYRQKHTGYLTAIKAWHRGEVTGSKSWTRWELSLGSFIGKKIREWIILYTFTQWVNDNSCFYRVNLYNHNETCKLLY